MLFPDIHVKIDKPYPNSNFRFDFYVFGDYIEICPMYNKKGKEAYTIKMNKKKNLFNCVLLTSIQEIDSYLKDKMNANNCR